MGKTVRRNITLPQKLVDRALTRADDFGFDLAEYIRYLIAKDLEENDALYSSLIPDNVPLDPIPLSKEELEGVKEALEQWERGEYTTLRTEEDIKNFVRSLGKEE